MTDASTAEKIAAALPAQAVQQVSRTQAMMAAHALRELASQNIKAAGTLEPEFPGAAENARALADWYTNVAGALEALDAYGDVIAPL